MSFYMYLNSSGFSKKIYPDNQPFDFTSTVLSPFELDLSLWEWEVALTEIYWSPKNHIFSNEIYIMSDLVDHQVQVGSYFLPLLRIVSEPGIFNQPYYMKLSRGFINSIRVYIKHGDNTEPDKDVLTGVRCTLHFRKVPRR